MRALDHREPDKVPVDMNGTIVTSLTRVAYQNLRSHLKLPPDDAPDVSHFAMDTVRAREDLLTLYGIDTRTIGMGAPFGYADKRLPDGSLVDRVHARTTYRWTRRPWYDIMRWPPVNGHTRIESGRAVPRLRNAYPRARGIREGRTA
jgi:uroporphyrinogen decarboxylase